MSIRRETTALEKKAFGDPQLPPPKPLNMKDENMKMYIASWKNQLAKSQVISEEWKKKFVEKENELEKSKTISEEWKKKFVEKENELLQTEKKLQNKIKQLEKMTDTKNRCKEHGLQNREKALKNFKIKDDKITDLEKTIKNLENQLKDEIKRGERAYEELTEQIDELTEENNNLEEQISEMEEETELEDMLASMVEGGGNPSEEKKKRLKREIEKAKKSPTIEIVSDPKEVEAAKKARKEMAQKQSLKVGGIDLSDYFNDDDDTDDEDLFKPKKPISGLDLDPYPKKVKKRAEFGELGTSVYR